MITINNMKGDIFEWIERKTTENSYINIVTSCHGYEVSITNTSKGIDEAYADGETVVEAFAKIMEKCP